MNSKPNLAGRRKSSVIDLKFAIKKYEKKVKALQKSRNSRSPSVTKASHSKSRSLLIESSPNFIYSRPEISQTATEYGLKSPGLSYLEEDLKNLRCENFDLKQKLSTIKKDYDMLIIQIKKQFDLDKQSQMAELTQFYIDKINACEEKFESKIKEKVQNETKRVRSEMKKKYEEKIKKMLTGQVLNVDVVQEQFLKTKHDKKKNRAESLNSLNSSFDMEHKVKLILDTKTNEFDRKLQIHLQENSKLRKENEALRQRTIELQTKVDTMSLIGTDKNAVGTGITSKYTELQTNYNYLKSQLDSFPKETLCVKCKAVINTNNELSKKILRIRDFLSN